MYDQNPGPLEGLGLLLHNRGHRRYKMPNTPLEDSYVNIDDKFATPPSLGLWYQFGPCCADVSVPATELWERPPTNRPMGCVDVHRRSWGSTDKNRRVSEVGSVASSGSPSLICNLWSFFLPNFACSSMQNQVFVHIPPTTSDRAIRRLSALP